MKIKIFLLLAVAAFALSCATTGGHQYKKVAPRQKTKEQKENVIKDKETYQKEIIKAEPKKVSISSTPKARASSNVVEKGRVELANGRTENAERLFQNAINIDPSNGVAYYYLARARYELGRYDQAAGVLDKAEELLSGSKEWSDAVDMLRELINNSRS